MCVLGATPASAATTDLPGQWEGMIDADRRPILVRLRLERTDLTAGVVGVTLNAETVPATAEQLRLFGAARARDEAAANRALARLMAQFGDQAVTRAVLKEGHLPEARFALPTPANRQHHFDQKNTLHGAFHKDAYTRRQLEPKR